VLFESNGNNADGCRRLYHLVEDPIAAYSQFPRSNWIVTQLLASSRFRKRLVLELGADAAILYAGVDEGFENIC
jgi:hypothetical protein